MSGFIFVPIVRVRNVAFLAIVRNVVCTNCRGAEESILTVTKVALIRSRAFRSWTELILYLACITRE